MMKNVPPLPATSGGANYATRNDAFSPASVWTLEGATLRIDAEKREPRCVVLAEVTEVRLEFAPTRPERNRYRCRLTLRNRTTLEFFNRTYVGIYDFRDTSAAYVQFVRELLSVVAVQAPACRFVSGAGTGNYVLGVAGFIVALFAVGMAGLFFFSIGYGWLTVLKLGLVAFYLPTAWRWLRRNRQRDFVPSQPPSDALPGEEDEGKPLTRA